MSSEHSKFKFSVTCHTDDLAIVYCLRGLCDFAQQDYPSQIAWGGTGEGEWRDNDHQVTFRFTDPAYRDAFVAESLRLLPLGCWSETGRGDSDPASPQR